MHSIMDQDRKPDGGFFSGTAVKEIAGPWDLGWLIRLSLLLGNPIIAKNEIGYKNLVKLSSNSYLNHDEFQEPYCEFKDLTKFNDGIIVTLGGLNSLAGDLFKKDRLDEIKEIYIFFKNLLNNNFYIEIQRHNDSNEKNLENYNLNVSKELNIPIIASHEVYYLEKNEFIITSSY